VKSSRLAKATPGAKTRHTTYIDR